MRSTFGICLSPDPATSASSEEKDAEPNKPAKTNDTGARNYVATARGPDFVLLRVFGLGNMVSAPLVAAFSEEEIRTGCRRFVFDLSECRGFDSTFMGCMVGLATTCRRDTSRIKPKETDSTDPFAALSAVAAEEAIKKEKEAAESNSDSSDEETDIERPLSPEEATLELQKKFGRTNSEDDGFVFALNVSEECSELLELLGVNHFVQVGGRIDLSQIETTPLPARDCPPDERRKLIFEAHKNLVEIDKRNKDRFGAFLASLSEELAKQHN